MNWMIVTKGSSTLSDIIYASAEAAMDKRSLDALRSKDSLFNDVK